MKYSVLLHWTHGNPNLVKAQATPTSTFAHTVLVRRVEQWLSSWLSRARLLDL